MVAGVLLCALLFREMARIHPHELAAGFPHRVYVSTTCLHCTRALAALDAAPGAAEILVVPINTEASPERDRLCARTLAQLRRTQGLLWRISPEGFLCQRLAEEGFDWLSARRDDENVQVPAWAVDGAVTEFGWTDAVAATLGQAGILAQPVDFVSLNNVVSHQGE